MIAHENNFSDKQFRAKIIEAILEYFEGNRTFRSVLALGITIYHIKSPLMNSKFAEVISQLNTMGDEVAGGKSFSGEGVKETFTTMLEKLTRD